MAKQNLSQLESVVEKAFEVRHTVSTGTRGEVRHGSAPALGEELEQRILVRDELVQAAIQGVLLGQGEVGIEQVAHRTGIEPMPVQPPLRARIDQSIGHQRLEHLQPRRALARRRQARAPETVQLELLPQLQGQPARAPLARPRQAQLAQTHADRIDVALGHHAGRKQRRLPTSALVMHLYRLAPRLALAGVNLPEVQHLALSHPPVAQTPVLHDAPVLVDLAVLLASIAAQKHELSLETASHSDKDQGLHYSRLRQPTA